MIHFIRPGFLLLLIPCLWLIWQLWKHAVNSNAWQKVCDPQLLNAISQTRPTVNTHLPLILFASALLFSVIALSGPSWSKSLQPIYRSMAGNVIVLDMSPNMLATDLVPNRFTRAKYKLIDLLNAIHDGSVGLVVYAGEAYNVAPITNDSNTLTNLAMTLDPSIMPVGGNNLAQGLQLAEQLLKQAEANPASITLITGSTPNAAALEKINALGQQHIAITILGVSPQPIPELSQYHYVSFTNDNTDIKALLAAMPEDHAIQKTTQEQAVSQWHDDGVWFILLAVCCALWAFRRGWWEAI